MLVELAVGDAYGAGFEYADPDFVAAHNTLGAYARHPTHHGVLPGRYTDDTQMTIAVAELLAAGEDWTPLAIADRFVDAFHRDPRDGYARRFQAFLGTVRSGAELLARIDPRSDKSGAAMRAGPIGLLPTVDAVLRHVDVQARVTHDTPDGVAAARAAALAVHHAHHGIGPAADTGRWIADTLGDARWARPWHGPVGSKGVASVRAALTALAAGGDTGSAAVLRACVAFTGDVDTVATVALAAASRAADVAQDLPSVLVDGLENGPYGRDFLAALDAGLLAATA
ncbi:MAG TPA: ADP-ribosylglycohydrolase family protein [Pseudonocardiaceae bacterium]